MNVHFEKDMDRRRLASFRSALRCPACRGKLDDVAGNLCCGLCDVIYPVVGGRPVLMTEACRRSLDVSLDSEDGRRMACEYKASEGVLGQTGLTRLLGLLRPPPIMHRYDPDLRIGPAAALFSCEHELVLNVGGGPFRVTPSEVTLNIGFFPEVDLLGDAHRIPFADDSVAAVFSLAVLEHVANPQRVVDEMVRVLRPGGQLYSEIPFIFFFHAYPADYQRFTREGLRHLFRELEELEIGLTHGPVSAVLQSANIVLEMLIPARPSYLRKIANGAFRWLVFPFKYIDLALRTHPDAHKVAGGFWVRGRKAGA